MRNLIRLNIRRWFNRLSTWYCLIVIAFLAAANSVMSFMNAYIGILKFDPSFYPVWMTAALLTVCAAVLLSRRDTDPVRNTVIAGYSKAQLLLAELPPALLFACAAALLMLLPMLRGIEVLRRFPVFYLLLGAVSIILLFCAAAVLTAVLSVNMTNRSLLICIIAGYLAGGVITATALSSSLMQVKSYPEFKIVRNEKDGNHLVPDGEQLNPEYIAPPDRTRVEILCLLLPQTAVPATFLYLDASILPANEHEIILLESRKWIRSQCEMLLRMLPACQLGMLLLFTALGLLRFRNTDMN